jgi:NAD(P)-dependent dehydrogenase (short-subunit alcohol dehydrogenase family)
MARALVVGASGGIGRAVAQGLQKNGHCVVTLSRSSDQFDITDEDCIAKFLGQLSGPFEKIIVATGALQIGSCGPEKTLKALHPEALAGQFALNAIGPVLVLKHALQHMPRDKHAIFVALSARVGSIGDNRLGGWYSYRASKAALNQLIHTAAIEVARSHKKAICVALHPGTVATRFTEKYPRHAAVSPEKAAANLIAVMDRLLPSQTGRFFDWSGAEVPW